MKKFFLYLAMFSFGLVAIFSTAVLADGMPIEHKKPEPILTPLDKALEEEQSKAPLPEEKIEQTEAPKAEPAPVPEERIVEVQPNTSFFGLSVGMYSPFSHSRARSASFGAEWQPGVKIAGVLQPLFGGFVSTKGAFMGYGGVGIPMKLTQHIMLMPSVSVGGYEEGHDGYDLGRRLAYRFGTELAYIFDSQSRIGLNAHIITNGTSLDRDDRTEVIGITYTTPVNFLSGGRSSVE